MRVLISFLIIAFSATAFAWGQPEETVESRALKLDNLLDKKGVAVLCLNNNTSEASEKTADLLNSILALVKSNVEVSQPAGGAYAVCVTVTKK